METRTKLLGELHKDLVAQGYNFESLSNLGTEAAPQIGVNWGNDTPDPLIQDSIDSFVWTEEIETTDEKFSRFEAEIAELKSRLDILEG